MPIPGRLSGLVFLVESELELEDESWDEELLDDSESEDSELDEEELSEDEFDSDESELELLEEESFEEDDDAFRDLVCFQSLTMASRGVFTAGISSLITTTLRAAFLTASAALRWE